MNRKITIGLLILAAFTQKGVCAPLLASADELKVDGVYRNNEVVVNNRNPKFSWQFDYDAGKKQERFEIRIGNTSGSGNVWAYSSTDETESVIYSGAAVLASEAVLRGGAGLAYLCTPQSLNTVFETKLTEVITHPVDDADRACVENQE